MVCAKRTVHPERIEQQFRVIEKKYFIITKTGTGEEREDRCNAPEMKTAKEENREKILYNDKDGHEKGDRKSIHHAPWK